MFSLTIEKVLARAFVMLLNERRSILEKFQNTHKPHFIFISKSGENSREQVVCFQCQLFGPSLLRSAFSKNSPTANSHCSRLVSGSSSLQLVDFSN